MANGISDLSGAWVADDGAFYFLRQDGDQVWWVGLSNDTGLQKGLTSCNVFRGTITDQSIEGFWADVPRGQSMSSGGLLLQITPDGNLVKQQSTGGFGATMWSRDPLLIPGIVPVLGIHDVFDNVKKNQNAAFDHSLLDNLKPYKDHAVVFGTVIEDDKQKDPEGIGDGPPHVNLLSNATRSYADFICVGNNSGPDGDFNFTVQVDRSRFPSDFSANWEKDVNPSDIMNKMTYEDRNRLHTETIMFGRTAECGDTQHYEDPPLLPGWGEVGASSVLLNGQPINGQIDLKNPPVAVGQNVRVTGVLVLDRGHADEGGLAAGIVTGLLGSIFGWLLTADSIRPDYANQPPKQNQEMHPVYSIDIINGTPTEDLTGVWSGDDGGTYYIHHLVSTGSIFCLGLSPFRDNSFATIFMGSISGMDTVRNITGEWKDVPLGVRAGGGSLSLYVDPGNMKIWSGSDLSFVWLDKLYDAHDATPHPVIKIKSKEVKKSCQGWITAVGDPSQLTFSVDTSHLPDQNNLFIRWHVSGARFNADTHVIGKGPLAHPVSTGYRIGADVTVTPVTAGKVTVYVEVADEFGNPYTDSFLFSVMANPSDVSSILFWCGFYEKLKHLHDVLPPIFPGPGPGPDPASRRAVVPSAPEGLQRVLEAVQGLSQAVQRLKQ